MKSGETEPQGKFAVFVDNPSSIYQELKNIGHVTLSYEPLDGAFLLGAQSSVYILELESSQLGQPFYSLSSVIYFALPELAIAPYGHYSEERLTQLAALLKDRGLKCDIEHRITFHPRILLLGEKLISYVATFGVEREEFSNFYRKLIEKEEDLDKKKRLILGASRVAIGQNVSIGFTHASNYDFNVERMLLVDELRFTETLKDY